MTTTPAPVPSHARSRAVTAVLLAVGVLWALLLHATTTSGEQDPFESPWYWWSWPALPALGAAAALIVRTAQPFRWAAALTGPFAVLIALRGTVWWDASDGASFWLLGEVFVGLQLLTIAVIVRLVDARWNLVAPA